MARRTASREVLWIDSIAWLDDDEGRDEEEKKEEEERRRALSNAFRSVLKHCGQIPRDVTVNNEVGALVEWSALFCCPLRYNNR